MNQSKDDYLKTIYRLGGENKIVSNKELSNALGVSPASISEMIIRLNKEKLIKYTPYKGVLLTPEGLSYALQLLRSHRLWEVFLKDYLGYKWSEVHEDADILEHASSPQLIEKLNDFLGSPEHCPHGSPIPSETGEVSSLNIKALSTLETGSKASIEKVSENPHMLDLLELVHISIGDQIEVLDNSKIKETVTIKSDTYTQELSYTIAGGIFVKI